MVDVSGLPYIRLNDGDTRGGRQNNGFHPRQFLLRTSSRSTVPQSAAFSLYWNQRRYPSHGRAISNAVSAPIATEHSAHTSRLSAFIAMNRPKEKRRLRVQQSPTSQVTKVNSPVESGGEVEDAHEG